MTDKRRDALINDALAYERAISRLNTIFPALRNEKRKADREARKNGEALDRSYTLLIEAVETLRQDFQSKSDALWKEAESGFWEGNRPYEDLFNAIFAQAAYDYETALSRADGSGRAAEIRKFAEGTKMSTILDKLDHNHKDFDDTVKAQGAEIREETFALKKRHKNHYESKIRCPNCGGGLYEFKPLKANMTHTVKCSGCSFVGVWTEAETEGAEE